MVQKIINYSSTTVNFSGWKNTNWVNGLRLIQENVIEDKSVLEELPDDVDSCTFAKFASTYYQVIYQPHYHN